MTKKFLGKKMLYSYKIYNSINKIDLDDWEQISQEINSNIYMDRRFLLTVENTMSNFSKFWYVIFYDDISPKACMVLSTFLVNVSTLAPRNIKKIIEIPRTILPEFGYFKVLFCGLPISVGQDHIMFSPNANKNLIIKLLDQIMTKLASDEKAKIIIYKEIDTEKCQQLEALEQLGYLKVDSIPNYCFKGVFSDFNDYYHTLKSNYRKNIRTAKKKLKNYGIRITHLDEVEPILQIYTPEVHQLYEAVEKKSEYRLEILPFPFFRELVKNLPNQVRFILAYQNTKIVGFSCYLSTNNNFYSLYLGIDYTLNFDSGLYFNLMVISQCNKKY